MADRSDLADVIVEFIGESRENLDQCELALIELETDPTSKDLIAQVFRGIHSIKGSASFLELPKIEAVAHAGESWLAKIRDGQLAITSDGTAALLELVDVLRRLLREVERTGAEGPLAIDRLVERVERQHPASPDDATTGPIAGALFMTGGDSRIRVDVGLLDRLMNLVGELVLARNQISQLTAAAASASGMVAPSQRLSLVTAELQEVVMKTRMQPIGNVWSRFPRVIRDLAKATGKAVRLQIEGRETELDKTIIEAIQDPLTHLVRNAIDHGIEAPDVRARLGKPREGTVSLRAFHEGGMVNIEVTDDGGGIDPASVRRKATAQNVLPADQIQRLSDRETLSLIFLPGFSTAERVTHISGRGVGMDVVKTNVERIGGSVDIQSRPEHGTTVRIKIPLTLAIIPALIVRSGGASYAIPQASLLEVVRLEGEQIAREVETIQGARVFRLRGKLLPLAYLHEELRVPSHNDSDAIMIVVLQADDKTFGLVVDDIGDTEEIVVKPLWKRLKAIACYAGATVMGDGRVALILDTLGLAQRIGVVTDTRERALAHRASQSETDGKALEQVLLCGLGGASRLAIPLSAVARLEELPRSKIERVGGVDLAQYRGQILPLFPLAQLLEERRRRPREDVADGGVASTVQVVVYAHGERRVGFVVDSILDIAEVEVTLEHRHARAGILGSMVINDRITEFLDVKGVLQRALPEVES